MQLFKEKYSFFYYYWQVKKQGNMGNAFRIQSANYEKLHL
jgi:hypothetical protein